jgi:hypothetical protein
MRFTQMDLKRLWRLEFDLESTRIHFARAIISEATDLKELQSVSHVIASRDLFPDV